MSVAANASAAAFELRGEMTTLCVLHLLQSDLSALARGLGDKVRQAPAFFSNTPVCIDLRGLADEAAELDFEELLAILQQYSLRPVGIRNASPALVAAAERKGLGVLHGRPTPTVAPTQADVAPSQQQATPKAQAVAAADEDEVEQAPSAHPSSPLVIERPVRSGQQVYAAGRDLVLLALASTGSELLADGSIHVYGPLRGRALAGVQGNRAAHIFCQSLEAELISIAGHYQVIEQLAPEVSGKPAHVWLDGEHLAIEPLA